MTGEEFMAEYVRPAFQVWTENHLEPHLAAHALSQIDIMAEVVANERLLAGRPSLPNDEVNRFRRELAEREPMLGLIRDIHDCHKHGRLHRAREISQGQRPERGLAAGHFWGVSHWGDEPIRYETLLIWLDDGSERKVMDILNEGIQAWERELDQNPAKWRGFSRVGRTPQI